GKILEAQKNGYNVILLFFWLRKVELAIERVKLRVKEGGHNIDPETIMRRYTNGKRNLFEIYLPIVDEAMIFDNSDGIYQLIAEKNDSGEIHIVEKSKFAKLREL
ncbi:zeta toxin, partial [Flavobacterium sp. SE-s28]|nr:zeta toxin [Flavobacterium silvaticum]